MHKCSQVSANWDQGPITYWYSCPPFFCLYCNILCENLIIVGDNCVMTELISGRLL